MLRTRLRSDIAHVGQALREPEAFALRWHREGMPFHWSVFVALALTAVLGTMTYGMVMGLAPGGTKDGPRGIEEMLLAGFYCTLAAGIGWSLPLPALYILNSLSGSRLRASTTFLAALVTTSCGGLAMIVSIPIAWFFTIALPYPRAVRIVHLAVFAAVGVALIDVFCRVIESLEPDRGRLPGWWLTLVGAIGGELFYAFDLFKF